MTRQSLDRIGIRTIGDLRRLSRDQLHKTFGNGGEHFWQLARGIDERRVTPDRDAKSVSHETTFAEDVRAPDVLQAWLMELTEQVARRLRQQQCQGRTVNLKVRYGNFDTITRAKSLSQPTDLTSQIWTVASELLANSMPDRELVVRLIGVGVSNLTPRQAVQQSLFEDEQNKRDSRLDEVADQIRGRFGVTSLRRASTVQHQAEHRPQPRPE